MPLSGDENDENHWYLASSLALSHLLRLKDSMVLLLIFWQVFQTSLTVSHKAPPAVPQLLQEKSKNTMHLTKTCRHVALLLLVIVSASAIPTLRIDANSTISDKLPASASLLKRECVWSPEIPGWKCDEHMPTLEQLVARIRDTEDSGLADTEHAAVFFTNLDDPNMNNGAQKAKELSWMVGWLKARGIKYYWWYDHINTFWRTQQAFWIGLRGDKYKDTWGETPMAEFDHCEFQALSAAAIHPVAYLFTPKGTEWKKNSAWETTEYWALTKNPNVKKVYRVDPRPWDVAGIKQEDMCEHSREELLWDRERGDDELEPIWECPW